MVRLISISIIANIIVAQVNSLALAYMRKEYDGEVYCMNLTCNNILVDCVFFKLNGTTDLTKGLIRTYYLYYNEVASY